METRTLDTIDPRFMTIQEWTDSMTFPLVDKVRPPRLDDPNDWKQWAMQVIQSHKVSIFIPPDPRYFDDWREWAYRFNQALS